MTGISTAGTVSNARVTSGETALQAGVLLLAGGRLRNSVVRLPIAGSGIGAGASTAGARVDRVSIRAGNGLSAGNTTSPVRITRTDVNARTVGLAGTGSVTLDQELLRIRDGGTGISASVDTDSTRLVGRHLTIVGTDVAIGINYVIGSLSCLTASLELRNSIVRGFETDILINSSLSCFGGTGEHRINSDLGWSAFDPSRLLQVGPGERKLRGNTAANPRFVAPKKGNFRLRKSSSLIDRGQPGKPGPGESKRDLDGRRRVLDGDGKRGARRDIGAYEFRLKKKGKKRKGKR